MDYNYLSSVLLQRLASQNNISITGIFNGNTMIPQLRQSLTEPSAPKINSETQLRTYKNQLKSPQTFIQAVEGITKLLVHLSPQTKQQFHGALNTISYRVGRPGFPPEPVQKLYNAALSNPCRQIWTQGYLLNISRWKEVVDQMVSGEWDPEKYTGNDGRFGTNKQALPTADFSNEQLTSRVLKMIIGTDPIVPSVARNPTPSKIGTPILHDVYRYVKQSEFFRIVEGPEFIQPFTLPHKDSTVIHKTYFKLTNEQYQSLQNESDQDWKTEYHLFILYQSQYGQSIKSPNHVSYTINSKKVDLSSSGEAVKYGYDISSFCQPGSNELQITATECCCSYVFTIRVVQSRDVKRIVSMIKSRKLDVQEGLQRVKNSFSKDNDDIVQLHITIRLLCPLGQTFIEVPVRSKLCTHVQCFDLESFLLFNKSSNKWNCPICNCNASVDNLVLDCYMEQILEKVGSDDNGESVKIAEDGTWEVFDIDFGDHSESEDEDTPLQKRPRPKSIEQDIELKRKRMRVLPPPKPDIIDLTL